MTTYGCVITVAWPFVAAGSSLWPVIHNGRGYGSFGNLWPMHLNLNLHSQWPIRGNIIPRRDKYNASKCLWPYGWLAGYLT